MTLRAHEAGLADAHESARATGVAKTLNLYSGRTSTHPLHILIIGCGLGGLAAAHCLSHAGHTITILESAPAIGEIGAGIQVTPNVSRLLIRWGLGEALEKIAVRPEAIALRRYNTGELIGWTQWGSKMDKEYGSPYYHIHRADFHRLLLDLVTSSPTDPSSPDSNKRGKVTLRLNATVESINPSIPSLTLSSGEVVGGSTKDNRIDLIIGADGVKSTTRDLVIGKPTSAIATGDAAYRAIIPTDAMLADPELRRLVEYPEMTGWMGPGRHVMAYCIRAKKEYNLVLLHPDDGSVESWTADGSAEKMRADFAGWEPRVQKMLNMVPSTLKWKLMDRPPLPTWIHPEGKVVLLGDACHPMLPYRAQGAAMAIEDAAVLGNLLSHLSHPAQLPILLKAYQGLRYARTAMTQRDSRMNQHIFHLEDGREQERRDESMRRARDVALFEARAATSSSSYSPPLQNPSAQEVERSNANAHANGDRGNATGWEDGDESNPNSWANRKKSSEQFGYDADEEAEKWWREEGERVCRGVGVQSAGAGAERVVARM